MRKADIVEDLEHFVGVAVKIAEVVIFEQESALILPSKPDDQLRFVQR